jgi:hypothetical protein
MLLSAAFTDPYVDIAAIHVYGEFHGSLRMQTRGNSREGKYSRPLDKISNTTRPSKKPASKASKQRILNCRELTLRIISLESDLQRVMTLLNMASAHQNALSQLDGTHRQVNKRGRKPKLDPELLIRRRDTLIWFLEDHWPQVESRLVKAKRDDDFREALRPVLTISSEIAGTLDFRGLARLYKENRLRKIPSRQMLKAFALKNKSVPSIFNNLPSRNLANALAGVPNISCRTSLEECAKTPSQRRPAVKMWMHYWNKYEHCPKPPIQMTNEITDL